MPNDILIGIDAGTTVFKAAAFDARTGKALAIATRKLPIESPQRGWHETPASALDRALAATFRELRTLLQKRWSAVTGIGIAAQGGSSIFTERATGDPATSMVLWNDGRASIHAASIRCLKPEAWWQKRLLNAWTPSGLPRLQWFAKHTPEVFGDDRYIHVGAGEYLYHRLTSAWRQDAGNAIQIGAYNAATGKLTDEMLRLVGFSKDRVAPLRDATQNAVITDETARRYKLPTRIPVAGPYIDQEAALQSVRGVSDRPLLCSLGTAWVGNFSLPADRLGASSIQFVLRSDRHAERTVILPLLAGNSLWDWFLRGFVSRNQQRAFALADEILSKSLVPPEGVVCVPHLVPVHDRATTAVYGIGSAGSVEDTLRSVACGLCCELHRVFAAVKSTKNTDSIILSGGASKSRHFCALIATLFAPLPVYVSRDHDSAGARGALLHFAETMGKSPVACVKPSLGKKADRIAAAYGDYLRAYSENSDDFAQSVAYTFPKEPA